jgi:hypothetical protein
MGPPLWWSSGQSSWLQIQMSRVRFPAQPNFLRNSGFMSTIEELLGRNNSGSGLENREYGRGDPLRWPRDTLYPQKLALTSSTSGGRSVGIVRLRTKATEFFLFIAFMGHIHGRCQAVSWSEGVSVPWVASFRGGGYPEKFAYKLAFKPFKTLLPIQKFFQFPAGVHALIV